MIRNLPSGLQYSIDGYLAKNLDRAHHVVTKKDWDMVFIIDGEEGSGKSTLAQQIGSFLYPQLSLNNIVFSPDEFKKAILEAEKFECIIWDEALSGLYSRRATSIVNKTIVSMMAEVRQKNLFVIVVLPTFFDLDRNISIWRSRALIHTYAVNFERGRFAFFDKDKKKTLYLMGKKLYNYGSPSANFIATFPGTYTVNEAAYRKKKLEAFHKHHAEEPENERRDEQVALIGRLQSVGNSHDERIELSGLPQSTYYLRLREYRKKLKDSGNIQGI